MDKLEEEEEISMKFLNKFFILTLLAILLVTYSLPPSYAAGLGSIDDVTEISNEEIEQVAKMVRIIEELDTHLDMENLANNTIFEIENLSEEAQKFYYFVKGLEEDPENLLSGEEALIELTTYMNNMDSLNIDYSTEDNQISPMSIIGSSKKYYISDRQIRDLNLAVGGNTGFWTLAAAIAQIWGKSPTVLTAMLIAIPIVGIAGINICNRQQKGIVITHVRIGATHSATCVSQ